MEAPRLLGFAALGAALSVTLGSAGEALAEDTAAHGLLALGVARPMMNHALYGFGPTAMVGADLALGAGEAHRGLAFVRWTGFPATGARADIGSLEAAWRWQPPWAMGGFVQLGSGVLFETERLTLTLPGRTIDASNTRFGAPASAAIGFRAWSRVEVEAGYQQLLFFHEAPRTVGVPHVSIGGRL